MSKKRLPRSQRKYIRQEKAQIRREVFDLKKQQELIDQLYQKFLKKPTSKKPLPKKKTLKKPTKIQEKAPKKTG